MIVQEVCQAIIQELKDEIMPLPRTQEDWKAIAQQFQDRWNVPHALGGLGWQAHSPQETTQVRQSLLQLQGLLLRGSDGPGGC